MALVMPAAGEPYLMKPLATDEGARHPDRMALSQLQAVVGGYIEAVYLRSAEGERIVMFVNEDGKRLDLPLNLRATQLAHEQHAIGPDDWIVGDVVLCTWAEAGADDPNDPDEDA